MFHSREHEAKQAGAIEAARDPNSAVTSEDAERVMVNDTKSAGGVAYQFDPNASPEDKAAQARAHVPEGFHHEHKSHALNIVSDADDGAPVDYALPSPTAAGAIANQSAEEQAAGPVSNGALPEDSRWARNRTGWEPRFGNGDPEDAKGPSLLEHQTWVEGNLEDKWYGDWYYNAAVIVFACLSTYVVTLLGGGLASVFIIMAVCATYYRTSLRRVRRNFRDDIHRELANTRLETDTESLEWINSFLVKFWPIFAPVLCDTIINSVDQVLSTSTPAFLDSLRMKTFILGTKPPRLEHVKTYPKSEENIVLMDWKFSFNPNDVADLTARQLKSKINPKVVLEIRIGKGVISKGLDVIVEDFAFSGLMQVKVKLQIPFPHVEKAEVCFIGRPTIDYVCKPLGGDTFGFDINFVPGLEGFIQEQIHANLAPMFYAPNVFPIEIAKLMSGSAVDQAIGVVQIVLHNGQGLKNPDKFPGIPDPYVHLSINSRDVLGQTKTVKGSENPQFNETFNVIVTSLKDNLTMHLYDYNEFRKDKELGVATFSLERLEEEIVHENLHVEVMGNGKARGVLAADIRFFPVLSAALNADGTAGEVPESNTGIAKFTVEQAKELDGSKSMIGQLNPYAVLLLNGKEVHTSQKLKRTNNPIWPNASKELLITDRKSAKLGLVIKDERDIGADPIIGTYQIKLNDMIELMAKGQEWYNLAGVKTGRTKMMLEWKPVGLKGGVAGSGGYVTPIGVMRLHFRNARELRNLETMGKSDPYVRVLLSGIEKGRTVTFQNNLNPDFDEVVYVPMHNPREKLTLEVMDSEAFGRDRTLGSTEITAADFIKMSDEGEYMVHDVKAERSEQLKIGNKGSSKGVLNFTCSFYPTYYVADPTEEADEDAVDSPSGEPQRSTDAQSERSGTVTSLHRASASVGSIGTGSHNIASTEMGRKLNQGESDQAEVDDVAVKQAPKIKIGVDDLASYESGLIVFKLIDAELAHSGCHVEVIMDDLAFPSYRSSKARTRQMTFNETADAMVRELDFSKITVRLREKTEKSGDSGEDHTLAKLGGQTMDVLRRGLYQTLPLTLKGDDGKDSHITVQLKYLPIKMTLDPSESINNMGSLRVEVLDAAELPAADKNGFSDPYCKFELNGKQIHKTETQKKTLHPAWNEFFEVPIPSRTAAKFRLSIFDWDRGDKDDFLGGADVNLRDLDPFVSQEMHLGLDGKSGTVRLKMIFKPDYITRSRQGSSTMAGTFAVPGKVIGAPVKGVGKGAVFVGGNVLRGASFIGRGFRKRKDGSTEAIEEPMPADAMVAGSPPMASTALVPPVTAAALSPPTTPQHMRQVSSGQDSMNGRPMTSAGTDVGTASFAIVSATGFEGGNIRVLVNQISGKGSKEIHKTKATKPHEGQVHWGETDSFRVMCSVDTQFQLLVKEVKIFGSDDDLGEGAFPAVESHNMLSTGNVQSSIPRTVQCGGGSVTISSGWTPGDMTTLNTSPGNRSRRSFLGRSPRERDITPSIHNDR